MFQNDSSVVNVTVEDVNEWDPHFRYSHYEFHVSGQPDELIGHVEVGDGDVKDKLTLSLVGTNASMFILDPSGELRLKVDKRTFWGGSALESVCCRSVASTTERLASRLSLATTENLLEWRQCLS